MSLDCQQVESGQLRLKPGNQTTLRPVEGLEMLKQVDYHEIKLAYKNCDTLSEWLCYGCFSIRKQSYSKETDEIGTCSLTIYEPRHEKTGFLPMRKQRRRSAVQ